MNRRNGQTAKNHTRAKGHDTRERIINVAENVFAQYGYLAARVDDIADEVGVRRSTLFYHFPNKQALYVAVINRAIDDEAEYFSEKASVEAGAAPVTELEQLTDASFNFMMDYPNFSYLVLHTLASNRIDDVPTKLSSSTLEWWRMVLERGQAAGAFCDDVTVAECIALVGGITTFYITIPHSQTEDLNAISGVNRERIRLKLQRLVKELVVRGD
jgi:TetR/AcrR family transcriptional regulator